MALTSPTNPGLHGALLGFRRSIDNALSGSAADRAVLVLHARVVGAQLRKRLDAEDATLPPAVQTHRKWLLSRMEADLEVITSEPGAQDSAALRKHARALLLVAHESILWLSPAPGDVALPVPSDSPTVELYVVGDNDAPAH